MGWEGADHAGCFCQPSRRREPHGPEADLSQPQGWALSGASGGPAGLGFPLSHRKAQLLSSGPQGPC